MNFLIRVIFFLATALLVACGDGSSTTKTPSSEMTKYVGTWKTSCSAILTGRTDVTASRNQVVFVTNADIADRAYVRVNEAYYGSSDCSGIAAGTVTYPLITALYDGTKTATALVNPYFTDREVSLPEGSIAKVDKILWIGSAGVLTYQGSIFSSSAGFLLVSINGHGIGDPIEINRSVTGTKRIYYIKDNYWYQGTYHTFEQDANGYVSSIYNSHMAVKQ